MRLVPQIGGLARRVGRRLDPVARPIVISYPKSGRTQLRVMLRAIGVSVPFHHAGADETLAMSFERLRAGPPYWRRQRILFLLRDPRDTAVSAFFQATRRSRVFQGDFGSFLRDPLHGLEKILFYHLLWLEAGMRFRAFQVLEYEMLQQDPRGQLRRATAFLCGREPDETAIGRAIAAGRFETMRRLEESGLGAAMFGIALAPGQLGDPDSYKTRRGVIGGWRDYFPPADVAFAESLFDAYSYRARRRAAGCTALP